MGLANWFSTFCTNIQVQDSGTISTRYKAITRRLNTDFWNTTSDTSHSLYVGSYGRNTAIQGFSDLDMIFRLPYSMYEQYDQYKGNGQSSSTSNGKKFHCKDCTQPLVIGADRTSNIEVSFTDGITFEIVPTFIKY